MTPKNTRQLTGAVESGGDGIEKGILRSEQSLATGHVDADDAMNTTAALLVRLGNRRELPD